MKQANVKFTYRDYLHLPGDKRYEILEGELRVVPAPTVYHQQVSRNLVLELCRHVSDRCLGQILYAPCDVVLTDDNVVQPDILFVAADRQGIIGEGAIQGPPDLVVEILSEGTASVDREIKRKLYAKCGVREYWIVDPAAKTVEVLGWEVSGYTTVKIVPETGGLFSPVFPELNLPLQAIFG
jgi:Uma2 family endonuclease